MSEAVAIAAHSLAVCRRQYLVWRKLIWASLTTNVANPLLFLFAFGFGLGAVISDLGERVEVLPDRLLVYSDDGDEVAAKVHERGLRPVAVLVRRSTLEDVFQHLTGRTLVD